MKGMKIIVTYNCNIMCSNCINKCGPHRKGIMDVESFEKAALTAYNCGYNDYLFISGGEPFLHSGIVYKYLKSINSLSIKKNIITNGYWGNIEPFADILEDFKKIGLGGITIEYDYFHAVFIDIETIKKAIEICIKEGIEVTVRGCFMTNGMSDQRDNQTFKYIKELKREYRNIKLSFDVLDINKDYISTSSGAEKIILFK